MVRFGVGYRDNDGGDDGDEKEEVREEEEEDEREEEKDRREEKEDEYLLGSRLTSASGAPVLKPRVMAKSA